MSIVIQFLIIKISRLNLPRKRHLLTWSNKLKKYNTTLNQNRKRSPSTKQPTKTPTSIKQALQTTITPHTITIASNNAKNNYYLPPSLNKTSNSD